MYLAHYSREHPRVLERQGLPSRRSLTHLRRFLIAPHHAARGDVCLPSSHINHHTMTQIMNIPAAKKHRRALRRNATTSERMLWETLRRVHIPGMLFRRQFSVHQFVLDFYVPRVKLAIEIDGISHDEPGAHDYDIWRQSVIERLGIEFMRFRDEEVTLGAEAVASKIVARVREKLAEKEG